MPSFSMKMNRTLLPAVVAGLALTFGVPADAGVTLSMDIVVTADDGGTPVFSNTFNVPQIFNLGTLFQFDPMNAPELAGQDFTVQGPITVQSDIDSITGLLMSVTENIVNNSNQTLEFVIGLTANGMSSNGQNVSWTTNSDWNLTGSDPSFSSFGNLDLWTVGIDGSDVGSMHPAVQTMNLTDGLTIDGTSIFGNHGPILGDMSIVLAFEITPGSDAGVNGVFAAVPAPGALALFGIAAFAGRRRRR